MALVLRSVYDAVRSLDSEYRDTRTDDMFLMGSPWKIIGLSLLYYVFIKKIGPELMKNRQPYELKNILLVYNLAQVASNAWFFYIGNYPLFNYKNYADWSCMTAQRNNTPEGKYEIWLAHCYYMLKIADYLDTIFFVLRKRYNQITFLHVYHHILMALMGWFGVRYIGGGHCFILGYINVLVHAVMYFYYFVSALSADVKKSIWWKKYITQLQILQFMILIVHFARAAFNKNCGYRAIHTFAMLQGIFMFLMFSDFYYKAYVRKPKRKTNEK